ncbi:accessory Sec system glycosylation chaperone GtfB [Streptococcus pluranimalium]|uniref:accessory Sec system glycosylation chaperone GtfB n=1 Tax=Streptococcus pluranimalium TaxID=82348 RepID=UPI003F68DD82
MIMLFDNYDQSSWDLHYSLFKSGYVIPAVVIQDDGFLPHDVISPYSYYTGYDLNKSDEVYFNQVTIPDYWEIIGDNSGADIFDYHHKRAHIDYAMPKHQRLVKSISWYDEEGHPLFIDRYNRQGYRFAQTFVNSDGIEVTTTYFDVNGVEIIIENHTNGTISLNQESKVMLFESKVDFVCHFLKQLDISLDRIFYNSLSTPYFVARNLSDDGKDILFWHEDIASEIPDNMELLLEENHRQTQIAVQQPSIYEKMLPLIAGYEDRVKALGYIYHFKSKKSSKDIEKALILTNSDSIESLESLVTSLPTIEFHIGAITEMSSKLMDIGRFSNVILYPNITTSVVQQLFANCQIYLDINYGNEILQANRTSFENELLILGFRETIHEPKYVSQKAIFSKQNNMLGQKLAELKNNSQLWLQMLHEQQREAGLVDVESFKNFIG